MKAPIPMQATATVMMHHRDRVQLDRWNKLLEDVLKYQPKKNEKEFKRIASDVREGIERLEEQLRKFQRASNRLLIVETGIELLDKEDLWRRLQEQPAFKGGANQMEESSIPHPDDWDSQWTSRVRSMATTDILTIYRQWLQRCAFMIAKAEVMGQGSQDYEQFQVLYDWHACFSQRVFALAPEAWAHRYRYDIETLLVCDEFSSPERNHLIQYMCNEVLPKEIRENIMQAYDLYLSETHKLQKKHSLILKSLNNASSFAGMPSDRIYPWASDINQCGGIWELTEALEGVLRQQKMALQRFEYSMHRITPASVAVKLYVVLYPQCALTMLDLAERLRNATRGHVPHS